jgi:hypothetical protein
MRVDILKLLEKELTEIKLRIVQNKENSLDNFN